MLIRRFLVLVVAALVLVLMGGAERASSQPVTPSAPLCLAAGQSVRLAWSLPPGPKPSLVVIYRAEQEAAAFVELARVDATTLSHVDDTVQLGRVYQYTLATVRGAAVSPMSAATQVLVGGSSRVLLRGGSIDKAVFEVTVFRAGRKLSASFVHGPGEQVGDLVHVPELQRIEDFRLGLTLRELSLSRAKSEVTSMEELKDADGKPLLDFGGKPLRLEFRAPGSEREVLTAALALKDGRVVTLTEGTAFVAP